MRKRLTKEEIRQDPFLETLNEIARAVLENGREIIVGFAVFCLLFAGGLVLVGFLDHRNLAASELEDAALVKLRAAEDGAEADAAADQAKLDEVAKAFREVIEQYPRSSAAQTSTLFLGQTLRLKGDYEEAIRVFESLIQRDPDDTLVVEAQRGIAYARWGLGKTAEAEQALNAAMARVSAKPADKAAILIELARLAESGGDFPRATELFEEVSATAPDSPWAREAQQEMSLLPSPTTSETTAATAARAAAEPTSTGSAPSSVGEQAPPASEAPPAATAPVAEATAAAPSPAAAATAAAPAEAATTTP
ncbi:MAG: tetratricopeptide repeat protein [Candidatus Schekmanbacteria bacterium]|nr:tetratricopeptide repeat protein [Candidatus Schekmanbacteria bacterium]